MMGAGKRLICIDPLAAIHQEVDDIENRIAQGDAPREIWQLVIKQRLIDIRLMEAHTVTPELKKAWHTMGEIYSNLLMKIDASSHPQEIH